jgi:integrase
VEAARWGVVAGTPRLRFGHVAGWWIERFQRRVATGERSERTLDFRRYHLDHHLLPAFAGRPLREISVRDVRELLDSLREQGRAENTIAGALATLQCVMRFAVRNGWVADSPVDKLEADERPHPSRLAYRVLGREETRGLLDACLPTYRTLIATALYTGMRHSELLGLIWREVDPRGGVVQVRAQLSRARSGTPCRRVALKTRSARRQIPLSPSSRRSYRTAARGSTHDRAVVDVLRIVRAVIVQGGPPVGSRCPETHCQSRGTTAPPPSSRRRLWVLPLG